MYKEYTREYQSNTEKYRNVLIQSGGRPTRPIQYDPGHWAFVDGVDDCMSEEEDDEQREFRWVMDHWMHERSKFSRELHVWQAFHKFQRRVRRKPDFPWGVKQRIDNYWKERKIEEELKPQLQLDLQQQSKVDEWKEYYWYKHRQLQSYEEKVEKEEQEWIQWLKEFDEAPSGRGCSDHPFETKWFYGEFQSREMILKLRNSDIRVARKHLENHLSDLQWIEAQFPIIATELAASSQVSKHFKSSFLNFMSNTEEAI